MRSRHIKHSLISPWHLPFALAIAQITPYKCEVMCEIRGRTSDLRKSWRRGMHVSSLRYNWRRNYQCYFSRAVPLEQLFSIKVTAADGTTSVQYVAFPRGSSDFRSDGKVEWRGAISQPIRTTCSGILLLDYGTSRTCQDRCRSRTRRQARKLSRCRSRFQSFRRRPKPGSV